LRGQAYSFEELVCQLASREAFPTGSTYRRVEGAGGDGGVEAYWRNPSGSKTGYQAKYFLRSGGIDWAQVDKSVTQALATHPELEHYVVSFACDLTDRAGKRKGKTGWEHWETRVKKWKAEAAALGNKAIEFEAWPQSELLTRLIANRHLGIREYFFGDVAFSTNWFQKNFDEAVLSLDERFHPEDHVDVGIQKLFTVIARDTAFQEELSTAFQAIDDFPLPDRRLLTLAKQPDQKLIAAVEQKLTELAQIKPELNLSPDNTWDIEKWIECAKALRSENQTLLEWYWEYGGTLSQNHPDSYELHQCRKTSDELDGAVWQFLRLATSPYMEAEAGRFAFIRGGRGMGKAILSQSVQAKLLKQANPHCLYSAND